MDEQIGVLAHGLCGLTEEATEMAEEKDVNKVRREDWEAFRIS